MSTSDTAPDAGRTPAARKGRPGYDQRAVLEVAVAAFIEHGYDATSMGLLANRLGLSKAAIYHHFPAKTELLRSALDQALDGLEGVVSEEADGGGSAADRLSRVLRGAVRVLVEKLPYVTLLLRVRGNSEVERQALARRRAFDRSVTSLVVAARDEGSLRADIDPRVATRLLFGMINSIAEWYRPGGPETAEQLAEDVLAVALDGLRTPATAAPATAAPPAATPATATPPTTTPVAATPAAATPVAATPASTPPVSPPPARSGPGEHTMPAS